MPVYSVQLVNDVKRLAINKNIVQLINKRFNPNLSIAINRSLNISFLHLMNLRLFVSVIHEIDWIIATDRRRPIRGGRSLRGGWKRG